MKTLMRILVLLFMGSLLFPNLGSAQCNGNITIEKQSKLNDFNCTTWKGGSVTISGNSITDLTPLGLLESFQGDLIIDNNPNLVKLDGLENIEFLDGNLVVRANAILATLGSKTYKVEEITKQLIIKNCPNLTTKNDYFPLLQKIGQVW